MKKAGASSGIGAAIAKNFARSGCKLVLTARNHDRLSSVAEECAKLASGAAPPLCLPGDLSKSDAIEGLVSSLQSHHQGLDILVNNAGIIELGSIEKTSLEQLDRLMNTNLRSVFELTRLLVPSLIESKGNIVNVSSVNGLRAFAGLTAYNVSKAAVDQFTRSTALELASKGVRVNGVNPGVIVTPLQRRGGLTEQQYEQFLERSCQTHALGRPGQPEEVATAVAFLADNTLSSFITGASLPVDGGRHAMCPR